VRWICHDDDTTCVICRGNHNRCFKVENLPVTHPNCRCGLEICDDDHFTQEELAKALDKEFNENQNIFQKAGRWYYNSEEALDIILKYDDTITRIANKLGIQKALIQTVLYQELRAFNVGDKFSDGLVIDRYMLNDKVKKTGENLLNDVLNPPRAVPFSREDSSTGLGQIFAATAIKAMNDTGYTKDDGTLYDANNPDDITEVWKKLNSDDEFNIEMVARNLKSISDGNQGTPSDPRNGDINAITNPEERTKAILGRYNGSDSRFFKGATNYGEETYDYYNTFEKFSESEVVL
jgi:hypothetical protein